VKSKNNSPGMYKDFSCGITHYLDHFHRMAVSTVITIIPFAMSCGPHVFVGKGKVVLVHAVGACRGRRCVTLLIL